MLIIHAHNNHHKDREYIYDVVLRYFWGLEYKLVYEERDNLAIELDGRWLYIDDSFFQIDEKAWLTESSLPKQPLKVIKLPADIRDAAVEPQMPVIYGNCNTNSIFSDDNNTCYVDIFGSAFFMMTRYEEVVKQDRDQFDRFPARASLAYQEGFLERPIINEYLEILWRWMKKYKEDLRRRERKFSIMPTHDVDVPFLALSMNWKEKLRTLVGDVVKRKSLKIFQKNIYTFLLSRVVGYEKDLNNTFDYIMSLSEKHNLVSNFYFMTACGRDWRDGKYSIFCKPIVELAREIIKRGHRIGIHPGFGSYNKKNWIKEDVELLRMMLKKEGINVDELGGRQHYLSWKSPVTFELYEDADVIYDTTLSYADNIGFRCGICYEYPVYNVLKHVRYRLKEYPLLIMDCTLWDKRYMRMNNEEILPTCIELRRKVEKYDGVFVLLWHNTTFKNIFYKEIYENLIYD